MHGGGGGGLHFWAPMQSKKLCGSDAEGTPPLAPHPQLALLIPALYFFLLTLSTLSATAVLTCLLCLLISSPLAWEL